MTEEIRVQWDHVLYRDGERLLLSVLCGSIGLYEVNIELDEKERENYAQEGAEYIRVLARTICSRPESYLHRRVEI